jgi:hypothetical protein
VQGKEKALTHGGDKDEGGKRGCKMNPSRQECKLTPQKLSLVDFTPALPT